MSIGLQNTDEIRSALSEHYAYRRACQAAVQQSDIAELKRACDDTHITLLPHAIFGSSYWAATPHAACECTHEIEWAAFYLAALGRCNVCFALEGEWSIAYHRVRALSVAMYGAILTRRFSRAHTFAREALVYNGESEFIASIQLVLCAARSTRLFRTVLPYLYDIDMLCEPRALQVLLRARAARSIQFLFANSSRAAPPLVAELFRSVACSCESLIPIARAIRAKLSTDR